MRVFYAAIVGTILLADTKRVQGHLEATEDDLPRASIRGATAFMAHHVTDGTIEIESDRHTSIASDIKLNDECSVISAPTMDSSDREVWLQKFKPCGWYRDNCQDMQGVEVLEANVVYPPNRDRDQGRGEGDEDLQKGKSYIVQFDVGIHPEVVTANDGEYSNYFGKGGVIDLTGGYIDNNETGYKTETYVSGETCLEVYAKAGNDGDANWGDIHGNSYGCMGKCGKGCDLGGGYAKNCMKHDVCGAFKSVAQGIESSGNCRDIDCGDEQMQTVAYCHKKGLLELPVTCRKEDFVNHPKEYDIRLTFGARFFTTKDGDTQEAACHLWTGWDRGQGAPTALHENGDRCPDKMHCASGRCDGNLWNKICKARLDAEEGCNESSDCKSNDCSKRTFRHPRRKCA